MYQFCAIKMFLFYSILHDLQNSVVNYLFIKLYFLNLVIYFELESIIN